MPIDDRLENVLYHQKRAHKAWLSDVRGRGESPTEQADELVWELLVGYGECIEDAESSREDIYKTAYELAAIALGKMPVARVFDIYRDALVDAVMKNDTVTEPGRCQAVVLFANIISTAFCEAHSDRLKKTIRHNRTESLSNELRLAKSIQSHLLPKAIPQIEGFDFAGRLLPAAEVGGDYWSIKHYAEDGIVTMKLADISGHGVAAATLVAAVKFISGGYYRGSDTPAEVMRQTNRVLTRETPYDVLVTMVYGWLRPDSCELTTVNAGHAPVFVCGQDTCSDIPPTGTVLGINEDTTYGEHVLKLRKGDLVFFGSDGIVEAGVGEQFGIQRLKQLISDNAHLPADELADLTIDTVRQYAGQPHDDISLLIVKVTGDPPGAS